MNRELEKKLKIRVSSKEDLNINIVSFNLKKSSCKRF